MRTFSDRVRHAVMFELIGLAIFTPGAALLFAYRWLTAFQTASVSGTLRDARSAG